MRGDIPNFSHLPFRKGGLGGFEGYFLANFIRIFSGLELFPPDSGIAFDFSAGSPLVAPAVRQNAPGEPSE